MSRRFSRIDLDYLNIYASHGIFVVHPLVDDMIGTYVSDPLAAPAKASVPAFVTPRHGEWRLLEVHAARSSAATVRQAGPYFKIEPSLRVGDSARTLGTYSQRKNKLAAGVPFSLFSSPDGINLPPDSILETVVSQYGYPATRISGTSVQYRIVNSGG